jgi:hypothetical protein
MPNPSRLTGNQRLILDQAANRDDGAVLPLPAELDLQGRTCTIVLESLLERHLIERIPMQAPSTRGHGANYRITPQGRAALAAARGA